MTSESKRPDSDRVENTEPVVTSRSSVCYPPNGFCCSDESCVYCDGTGYISSEPGAETVKASSGVRVDGSAPRFACFDCGADLGSELVLCSDCKVKNERR